jgi:uncharacterized LabA/DUF88 family protein
MRQFSQSGSRRLAVLIDAENASAPLIGPLLDEVAKYGTANVKRIYGDWTTPQLGAWKARLNQFAIQPIQQFRYTVGKNVTDSALIIDAMDLLHSGNFDGFCIVSSDSDFTRLACRLRESGITVYGFGRKKTPEPFVRACDQFIFLENLAAVDQETSSGQAAIDQPSLASAMVLASDSEADHIKLVRAAYDALAVEADWVALGALGNQLLRLSPSFDPRTYGYRKLSELVAAIPEFALENRASEENPGSKHYHVALKSRTEKLIPALAGGTFEATVSPTVGTDIPPADTNPQVREASEETVADATRS